MTFMKASWRGGSRIFSRGMDFQKNFENLVDIFSVDQFYFPISPKAFIILKEEQTKILKKQAKILGTLGVLGTFGKILTKKIALFWRALPLKLRIYWRLQKIFRVRHQKLIFHNSTKGDTLGRQGLELLRGSVLLNPPVAKVVISSEVRNKN